MTEQPMSLSERMSEYIRAAYSGIWISSHEHTDAIQEIAGLCQQESWRMATWNIATGLRCGGQGVDQDASDPLAAVRAANALSSSDETTVLILENFHHFLRSAEIIQAVAQQIIAGKQSRMILIVLSPVVELPVELEKLFVVLDHELPTRDQLQQIAAGVATESGEIPEGDELERVLDAASGLTRNEAENAFSLALVREGRLNAETIWSQKSQMLTKAGALRLYRGGDDFSCLGGLDALKTFTRRALRRHSHDGRLQRPRGVMLLSPPGCGKSAFCKALGKEVGRPVLMLDVGSLMGSLVGQSEERTRKALQVIDATAPSVLMIDEIEKAFAGVSGSSQNDSGVTSRMFGSFLTWLNDHQSDVFVVCTANDASKLPPEFSRSERFDGVFFVDLPGREQKDQIWQMYLQLFQLDPEQRRPDDENWTGAEIRACCRLAALLDVPITQSSLNVVPVAVISAESVDRLRSWADGRCLSADNPGVYRRIPSNKANRRSVSRSKPSRN
jgi:hypothetical protein